MKGCFLQKKASQSISDLLHSPSLSTLKPTVLICKEKGSEAVIIFLLITGFIWPGKTNILHHEDSISVPISLIIILRLRITGSTKTALLTKKLEAIPTSTLIL